MKNFNEVSEALRVGTARGGLTVDQKGNIVLQGIIVAQSPECGRILQTTGKFKFISLQVEINEWLYDVRHKVLKDTHFGIWVNPKGGNIVLDLGSVVPLTELRLALALARDNKQEAVQVVHELTGLNCTLWLTPNPVGQ